MGHRFNPHAARACEVILVSAAVNQNQLNIAFIQFPTSELKSFNNDVIFQNSFAF